MCWTIPLPVGLLVNVMPPNPSTGLSLACGPYQTEFTLAFCYMSISILLPLHLTYWYERQCKAAFLKANNQRHEALDAPQQPPQPKVLLSVVQPARRVACVMVSVMSARWLCILYAPVCAWLQRAA
jgi:hypothetical protein